jgi:hypothetical protein
MFQQLLEAAFILQEHNDRERKSRPALSAAETLTEIAATQQALHAQAYDVAGTARLIASQLQKIANASGVAIAVLENDDLDYVAAVGNAATLTGMKIPVEAGVTKLLQTDKNVRMQALQSEGSKGPILLPIYHDAKVVGLIDLRLESSAPVEEHVIGACQVLAGMMSESIGRSVHSDLKVALSSKQANMIGILEKLRPQLERLAGADQKPQEAPLPAAESRGMQEAAANLRELKKQILDVGFDKPVKDKPVQVQPVEAEPEKPVQTELHAVVSAISDASMKTSATSTCAQCGYQFGEGELFCGRCGTPRSMKMVPAIETEPDAGAADDDVFGRMQTQLQTPTKIEPKEEQQDSSDVELMESASLPPELTQALTQMSLLDSPLQEELHTDGNLALAPVAVEAPERVEEPMDVDPANPEAKLEILPPAEPAPTAQTAAPAWQSANGTLKWLKSLQVANSPSRVWLEKHRGDLSVVIAMIVLLVAVSGVGPHQIQPKPSGAQQNLTLFERMLVSLGLAEAPPVPVSAGNPNVEVWVDVHTALYYCPGADMYGKTPDGRTESQRDAQLDEFQPAARRNCQ